MLLVLHTGLHLMKGKKILVLILKLDLVKTYDKVDWTLLRLFLFKIRLKVDLVNWIMVGVSWINFIVLVNGMATYFFKAHWGIRQGCPLSPFLFLLIVEGLSTIILKSMVEGSIKGVKLLDIISSLQLVFVDDILLFGWSEFSKW